MNIQQIIYVMRVNDHHSFTEAAKSLYISQPRLSQAIRELETELGFDIFMRNRKGISGATVRGQEFIDQARVLLQQFSVLENFKSVNMSAFRLATTILTQPQDAYVRLCRENLTDPLFKSSLWFCGCYEAAERIRAMESDVGIVTILDGQYDRWMQYFKQNNIEYHALSFGGNYITMSSYDPLADRSHLTVSDLKGYKNIAERCSRMNDLTADAFDVLQQISPDSRITVSNTDMMYRLVGGTTESHSFIFDPVAPSAETLAKYDLVSIPFDDKVKVHVGYIILKDHPLTGLAERYLELLKEEF